MPDWVVVYHAEAVVEFEAINDRKVRRGVLRIVSILAQIGPKITEPHAKPVAGSNGLRELRPGGGKLLARPLYARVNSNEFVIFAIAPEAQVDPSGFRQSTRRAQLRAKSDYGLDL